MSSSSDDDDSRPLAKRRKNSTHTKPEASSSNGIGKNSKAAGVSKKPIESEDDSVDEDEDDEEDDDDDDDTPLSKQIQKRSSVSKASGSKPNGNTKVKTEDSKPTTSTAAAADDDDDDEDDIPISKTIKRIAKIKEEAAGKRKAANTEAAQKRKRVADKDVKRSKSVKSESGTEDNASQSRSNNDNNDPDGEDDQEESEEYKWWLDQNKDTSVKWKSLRHNGVLFAPPYVPHGVQMRYDGKPVALSPNSEEVASFFAALVGTDWAANPTFQKNFFRDFLKVLAENDPHSPIKIFSKCDFSPITDYLNELKERKKTMTKEEKDAIKAEKKQIEDKYGWAYLDNRKEKLGNYRIEPPGLFRGRGEHPKTGSLKLRVVPEQITINIGPNDEVPAPPPGTKWGSIIHDNTVTWLAMWKENVNDSFKYVFLAANSSLKGQSDLKKFEKARQLKKVVAKIRNSYTQQLKDKVMATRQMATAIYFIDRLALRAGNEKGEDEADTVGCCSLRYEHITLEPPNKVIFDFLGKDSIRYYNEVIVDDQVFKNIKIFKREPKKEGDPLFDRLNTTLLNKHLSTHMEGLTAKVFRTYNASYTFQEELKKTPVDGTIAEKLLAYNRANRQVAILCNHQRTVPKAHGNQMSRLREKMIGFKYERMKVKEQMLEIDPKLKRKRPELAEPESDLDEEAIANHEQLIEEREQEKNQKQLERENEKRKEDGLPPLHELPEKSKRGLPTDLDRLEKKYEQLSAKISAQKMAVIDKDENKTTALGTSKINYIDPRISAAWCHKYGVPLDKIFNKTLREKFKWAMDAGADWEF